VPATTVGAVQGGSPAEAAGFEADDVLARLGVRLWPVGAEVFQAVEQAPADGVGVGVLREGELVDLGPVKPREGKLGIRIGLGDEFAYVADLLHGESRLEPIIPPGSRIVSVEGEKVAGFASLQRLMQKRIAREAEKAGGSEGDSESEADADADADPAGADETDAPGTGSVAASPSASVLPERMSFTLGYVTPLPESREGSAVLELSRDRLEDVLAARWDEPLGLFNTLRVPLVGADPIEAGKLGIEKTGQYIVQTYITIVRLAQNTVQFSHLRGPIGIVDEGTRVANQGVSYLLFFLGLISVNLAVINFLPIPIVDGGHMLFLLIEKLKGSPVSVRVQNLATIIGLMLIGSVFLITLYHDLSRIVGVG
jgi:regulator of sigma E protease